MNFADLVNLDVRTLIGSLFWTSLGALVISLAFSATNGKKAANTAVLNNVVLAKLFLFMSFFLLYFRGFIPDVLSALVGNVCILMGFCFEAVALLHITRQATPRNEKITYGITTISIIAFVIIEVFFTATNLRIVAASMGGALILLFPTLILVFGRHKSTFLRILGLIYMVFIAFLIPRIVYTLVNTGTSLFTNTFVQSMTFISLLLITIGGMISFYVLAVLEHNTLETKMITTDYLTGLLNRQTFMSMSKDLFETHKKDGVTFSIALISIDNFRMINKEYGERFGDMLLQDIAEIFAMNVRSCDLVCRFSGKEFGMVMAETSGEDAKIALERIVGKILVKKYPQFKDFAVTMSVGICSDVPKTSDDFSDFTYAADRMLFNARGNPSERVVLGRVKSY